jgi:hypothetical protein
MPSSRPNTIPTVINVVRQLKPRSILDVGVGFGKWGHLFREYTDILQAECDPERYSRKNWQVRIDGIEGYAPYITDMHRYLYNDIHIGKAQDLINQLPKYDLIFVGDVIEHFEKQAGLDFLEKAFAKAKRAVVVTTPKNETGQADLCGNELERHRSLWSRRDFKAFGRAVVKTIDRSMLLAVLLQAGVARPLCDPPRPPTVKNVRRLQSAREELARIIPVAAPFILADEEHIRTTLPHLRIFPFLERGGIYWGPPPDDDEAIAELERLREYGAGYIAFIWSTFWWLHHYRNFADYLHANYHCIAENDRLVVFRLQK